MPLHEELWGGQNKGIDVFLKDVFKSIIYLLLVCFLPVADAGDSELQASDSHIRNPGSLSADGTFHPAALSVPSG